LLGDREAGRIESHFATLRDYLPHNFFGEIYGGKLSTSASREGNIVTHNTKGEEVFTPMDLSLSENYSRIGASFGYKNPDSGDEFSVFTRKDTDTSAWSQGSAKLYGFNTKMNFRDKLLVAGQFATGDTQLAQASARYNFTDDIAVGAGYLSNKKYDFNRITGTLSFPFLGQPVELQWNWDTNGEVKTNSGRLGVPVLQKDKSLKGIYDENKELTGEPTYKNPLDEVFKDMPKAGALNAADDVPQIKGAGRLLKTVDGSIFIPGLKSQRLFVEQMPGLGRLYYFTSDFPIALTYDIYPNVVRAEELVVRGVNDEIVGLTQEATKAGIGLGEKNDLVIKINGIDKAIVLAKASDDNGLMRHCSSCRIQKAMTLIIRRWWIAA